MVKSLNKKKLLLSISVAALMIGCSTSIAERSPIDIASNSLRRTDSYSGVSEVLAPQIKAFSSNRTSVKGHVQLRTAGPFTDHDGKVHTDGAYLEIVLDYATATPDPEGGLYFDQVNWAGGEAALLADFGETVLDCQEDVREIYRVPIGYTGYGHYGGHYGQYGRHGYGGYGYNRNGRRGGSYGGHGRTGSDRHDRDNDDHQGGDHDADNSTGRDGNVGTTPTGTTRRGVTRRDVTEDRSRVPAERDPELSTASKQPRRRIPISTIKSDMSSRAGRTISSAPVSRSVPPKAVPVSRPASPPPPPPPAKRQSSSKKNTSRSTDRAFKNTNNTRTRARSKVKTEMRYHPQSRYNPGYTDYVVNYSCQRQESLRVFIPRERLLAAQKNGLLLYLQPQNGIEETIALPPNYISGFVLAAYSPEGHRLTIEGDPTRIGNQVPQTVPPPPKTEPSARTPIIYGGN
jgi:hypothetical protein